MSINYTKNSTSILNSNPKYKLYSNMLTFIQYNFDNNLTNSGSGGSTYNGTAVGTATYSSSIKYSGSHSLQTATTRSVTIPTLNLHTSTNGLIFSFNINLPSTLPTSQTIMSLNSGGLILYTFNAASPYNIYLSFNGAPTNIFVNNVTSGVWHTVVFALTYSSGTTSICKSYLNGILNMTVNNFYFPTTPYSTNSIGAFTGYLDNFSISTNHLDNFINVNTNLTLQTNYSYASGISYAGLATISPIAYVSYLPVYANSKISIVYDFPCILTGALAETLTSLIYYTGTAITTFNDTYSLSGATLLTAKKQVYVGVATGSGGRGSSVSPITAYYNNTTLNAAYFILCIDLTSTDDQIYLYKFNCLITEIPDTNNTL